MLYIIVVTAGAAQVTSWLFALVDAIEGRRPV